MKIYLASSWKNARLVYDYALDLRRKGYNVDAFVDASKLAPSSKVDPLKSAYVSKVASVNKAGSSLAGYFRRVEFIVADDKSVSKKASEGADFEGCLVVFEEVSTKSKVANSGFGSFSLLANQRQSVLPPGKPF